MYDTIVEEFQGLDCDRGIWRYFRHHWLKLFPLMKSRSTFVRQAANLWKCSSPIIKKKNLPIWK